MSRRIFLSSPHMGGQELEFIREAFSSNYIAPVGPHIDAFEEEFSEKVGAQYAAAISSGTACLHLLLKYVGVAPGDEVICSTFTFVGSVNPILYQGGVPVFIDSNYTTWNMDPELLRTELKTRIAEDRLPKAVILVHLYGQPADIDPIREICNNYNVALLEDAAEALGAKYKGKELGTFGLAGFYSFNGNKIITTSGGGMIVSNDKDLIRKVKFWAAQSRDNATHYEHSEIGYNYRMSNILAAIGRGQLRVLSERVAEKRKIFQRYRESLSDLPGVGFMPEPDYACSSHWLTCLTIDPDLSGIDRNMVIQRLEDNNIESRPTWKPMHLQPLYKEYDIIGGSVAEHLYNFGICLPSGTNMTHDDLARVIKVVKSCWENKKC